MKRLFLKTITASIAVMIFVGLSTSAFAITPDAPEERDAGEETQEIIEQEDLEKEEPEELIFEEEEPEPEEEFEEEIEEEPEEPEPEEEPEEEEPDGPVYEEEEPEPEEEPEEEETEVPAIEDDEPAPSRSCRVCSAYLNRDGRKAEIALSIRNGAVSIPLPKETQLLLNDLSKLTADGVETAELRLSGRFKMSVELSAVKTFCQEEGLTVTYEDYEVKFVCGERELLRVDTRMLTENAEKIIYLEQRENAMVLLFNGEEIFSLEQKDIESAAMLSLEQENGMFRVYDAEGKLLREFAC